MGRLVDNDTFLQNLTLMYAGTKKWGTVRILLKRLFEEQHSFKLTKRKEQLAFEKSECADRTKEFDLIVRAANPKRKVSTVVKAANSYTFQKSMVSIMQQQMFKDVKSGGATGTTKKPKKVE